MPKTPDLPERRFMDLCDSLAVSREIAVTTAERLFARYAEVHRHYHNLAHLEHMLGVLDSLSPQSDALELAIWFHDVVYDPKSSKNESLSAGFFQEHLGAALSPGIVADVTRLILATDHARPRTGAEDEDLLRDLDLAILAAPPDEYRVYREAIRREYSHVPDLDFAKGRRAVLTRFLENRIYHTAAFVNSESVARENLAHEIAL